METKKENAPVAPKQKRSKVFIVVLTILVIAGAWFGLTKYIHALHHEETDDAQVEGNIAPVVARVGGYVDKLYVTDNQFVRKGDTLLTIDPRDLQIVLDQAKAALNTAESNLKVAEANTNAASKNIMSTHAAVATADAQIEAARVNVWRTTQDFSRYENLIKDHSITQQQFEQAKAAKELAERNLQVLVDQRNQVQTQTGIVASQTNATAQSIEVAKANIQQRKVDVEHALLNLSYTVVTAPESGILSKVPIQKGQLLQQGQSLFNIVLSNEKWVVANFKETQYNKMVIGQKVIVHADAFPKHDFEGILSSFSPATGAKFALLPPDNASGNFVKVVQRLPVKITFTNPADSLIQRLRPGMNVFVDVHIN